MPWCQLLARGKRSSLLLAASDHHLACPTARRQIATLELRLKRAEEEIKMRRDEDMPNVERTVGERVDVLEAAVEKLKARALLRTGRSLSPKRL